eukprot:CAMPEP_0179105254 /NCGR_PEP_ID=MMETSP0796-20121207/48875_1 /TAXON_ID=73915 /ORGANISM="Pyrodinium bahamense, Strain pbaha01" /LENGTH=53 /DNA_ID=CAMNT_0020803239 /DNA_START=133 /DNA_END=294 /DNA_ORIENTATION=+
MELEGITADLLCLGVACGKVKELVPGVHQRNTRWLCQLQDSDNSSAQEDDVLL